MGKKKGKKKGKGGKTPTKPKKPAATEVVADEEAVVTAVADPSVENVETVEEGAAPSTAQPDSTAHNDDARVQSQASSDMDDVVGPIDAGGTHQQQSEMEGAVPEQQSSATDETHDDGTSKRAIAAADTSDQDMTANNQQPEEEEEAESSKEEPAPTSNDGSLQNNDENGTERDIVATSATAASRESVEQVVPASNTSIEQLQQDIGTEIKSNDHDNDEDKVSAIESEATSGVSYHSLGNYSATSKDSAIAALAALDSAVEQPATSTANAVGSPPIKERDVEADRISPLPMMSGVTDEETKALPPLDLNVSIDPSPEEMLDDVGGDGGEIVHVDNFEADAEFQAQSEDEVNAEIDAAIDSSTLAPLDSAATAGSTNEEALGRAISPGSTDAEVGVVPVESMDSTKVEIGNVDDDNFDKQAAVAVAAVGTAAALGIGAAAATSADARELPSAIEAGAETNEENPFEAHTEIDNSMSKEESDWVTSAMIAGGSATFDTSDAPVGGGDAANTAPLESHAESNIEDETSQIDENDQSEGKNGGKAVALAAGVAGAAAVGVTAAALAAPDNVAALPATTPSSVEDGAKGEVAVSQLEQDDAAAKRDIDAAGSSSSGDEKSNDSSEGSFYKKGTFSDDDESSVDVDKEDDFAPTALAALGVTAGAAGAVAVAAGLHDDYNAEMAPEVMTAIKEEETKFSEDDLEAQLPQTVKDGSREAPQDFPIAPSSLAAETGSVASPRSNTEKSRAHKKRGRTDCILIIIGVVVLVAGLIGIALAVVYGRRGSRSVETLAPTFLPTTIAPSAIPTVSSVTSPPPSVRQTPSPTSQPTPMSTAMPTPALTPINPPSTSSVVPTPSLTNISGQPTSPPITTVPVSPSPTTIAPTAAPTAVLTSVPTSTPTTIAPTAVPTPLPLSYEETLEELQNVLGGVVPNPAALEDPDSPQYSAITWLASDLSAADATRRLQEVDQTMVMQRYALAAIYFSTNGADWINPDNEKEDWVSPFPECEWYGITCIPQVFEERALFYQYKELPQRHPQGLRGPSLPVQLIVTEIELDGHNLSGPLPADITLLSGLKTLSAANNNLTGVPNAGIKGLTLLERLYLNSNAISQKLPRGISLLSNLVDVQLQDNFFVGTIPEQFGNLVNLYSLELHDNDLTGIMPDSVCVLRYVPMGKNDILAILSADCESMGDEPPQVECDCCTNCFAPISSTPAEPEPDILVEESAQVAEPNPESAAESPEGDSLSVSASVPGTSAANETPGSLSVSASVPGIQDGAGERKQTNGTRFVR